MLALTFLQLSPPPPATGCDVCLYLNDWEGVTRTGQSGRTTTSNTCFRSLCAKPLSTIQTPRKDNLLPGKKPSYPGPVSCVWLVVPGPKGRSGTNQGLLRRLRTRQRGVPGHHVHGCPSFLGPLAGHSPHPTGATVLSGHSPPAPPLLQLKRPRAKASLLLS